MVGHLWYISNTCNSQKFHGRNIKESFKKVLDNAIYSLSQNIFENNIFTEY